MSFFKPPNLGIVLCHPHTLKPLSRNLQYAGLVIGVSKLSEERLKHRKGSNMVQYWVDGAVYSRSQGISIY